MKKLNHLLQQRRAIVAQARLANLAFAYDALTRFAARVERAQLRGRVALKPVNPDEERFCVTLTALEASQSVIDEHFDDDDLLLLADVIGFATGHPTHELIFTIDQLGEFIEPLRADLEHAGVEFDSTPAPAPRSDRAR